jgi:hypothetical protein
MVKVAEFERPPPGAGLNTVTVAAPAVSISGAGIWAVMRLLLTNAVVRLLPLHCTTEVGTKFDPFTIRVNPAPPFNVIAGDRDAIAGAGICFTETAGDIPELASPTVSLAVIVWLPVVLKVTVNVPTPCANVELGGSFADLSELVIWTVPT